MYAHTCRHPNPSLRPNFCETVVMLQHPDFQILKWAEEGGVTANERAKVLGSALEEGLCLYPDLQNNYKSALTDKKKSSLTDRDKHAQTSVPADLSKDYD